MFLLCPQVVKRGMAPGGGGEVVFTCPVRRTMMPVQLTDPGKIKRIRGVAYPCLRLWPFYTVLEVIQLFKYKEIFTGTGHISFIFTKYLCSC